MCVGWICPTLFHIVPLTHVVLIITSTSAIPRNSTVGFLRRIPEYSDVQIIRVVWYDDHAPDSFEISHISCFSYSVSSQHLIQTLSVDFWFGWTSESEVFIFYTPHKSQFLKFLKFKFERYASTGTGLHEEGPDNFGPISIFRGLFKTLSKFCQLMITIG